MKKLKAIVIGAGSRGMTYSKVMKTLPEQFEIVAVAEPMKHKRNYLKEQFNLPEDRCFESWEPLLELGKIADFALIATMDRMHYEPAMKAMELKYDLLLEKPIAPTPEECTGIAKAAKENGVKVVICHVLRYTDFFLKLKEIIQSGEIGKVMSINHEECVGNVHQSHSFVRGNWGNSTESSPMLLQKSCHDLDILQWLLDKKCKKIQSFGTLSYFTEANAPEGAPERCIDGCPHADTCPYNAIKLYLESNDNNWFRPTATHSIERDNYIPTDADVEKALRTTQYGKCVYKCNNDVVDHQVVNMLFEDDITVSFTMNAFNKGGRFIHIMGTKGELRASMDGGSPMTVYNFETKETRTIDLSGKDGVLGGHGGGDEGIVWALYDYFTGNSAGNSMSEASVSCKNHMLVFAAEKSRAEGTVVDIDEFMKEFEM